MLNKFNALTEQEVMEILERDIQTDLMSLYLLPALVTMDLSGSMHYLRDNAFYILKCLKEAFTRSDCKCDMYLVLSEIHGCKNENDSPNIVYCGYIDEFDFDAYKEHVKTCSGLTPICNSLKQVNYYGDLITKFFDRKERVHTCPVNMFITDYLENVSNNSDINTVVEGIQQQIEDKERIVIEFSLTDSQMIDLGVQKRVEKAISFGGYNCRYDKDEIENMIDILKLSSDSIGDGSEYVPPRGHIDEYNEHLRRVLTRKFSEYWDHINS